MKTTTRQLARDFFEGMRYQHVHTWHDSHGNGGQDMYERMPPMEGNQSEVYCVCFDRDGQVSGMYQTGDGSFLLAKDVLSGIDWEKVDGGVSACCTSAHGTYRQTGTHSDWGAHLSQVAGHGDRATWTRLSARG